MHTLIAILFLINHSCFSKEKNPLKIHADQSIVFHIKDQTCRAKGNVLIHQDKLSLLSDRVFLRFQEIKKKRSIQFLDATGHVRIHLAHGCITGGRAFYQSHHKQMTIQNKVRFDGLGSIFLANDLDLFFATTPGNDKAESWTLHTVKSPNDFVFQNKEIQAKGDCATYTHHNNTVLAKGNVQIIHQKHYLKADQLIADLQKKCYRVSGTPMRCLIDTQQYTADHQKNHVSCGKKSL